MYYARLFRRYKSGKIKEVKVTSPIEDLKKVLSDASAEMVDNGKIMVADIYVEMENSFELGCYTHDEPVFTISRVEE